GRVLFRSVLQRLARAVAQRIDRLRAAGVHAHTGIRPGAEEIAFLARGRPERTGRVGQPAGHVGADTLVLVDGIADVVDAPRAVKLSDRGDPVQGGQAAVVDDLDE